MRGREKKTHGGPELWDVHCRPRAATLLAACRRASEPLGLSMSTGLALHVVPASPAVLPGVLSPVSLPTHVLITVPSARPPRHPRSTGWVQCAGVCQRAGTQAFPVPNALTSLHCQEGLHIRGSHQFFSPCKSLRRSDAIALSVMHEGEPAARAPWTVVWVLPKCTPRGAAICLSTPAQLATLLPSPALRLHP